MLEYRTSGCRARGQREFTLTFREERPFPIERVLLDYFEKSVAQGTTFAAGQTVQLGWAMFRLCSRNDGTWGVEEREGDGWVESVDRSLMQVWYQKEVASSVGLGDRISSPRQDQAVMVRQCAFESMPLLITRLDFKEAGEQFSGWSFACSQQHDHGEPKMPPLLMVTEHLPFTTQFLALPVGSSVLIVGPGRIRAYVFVDGEEITPREGSYLAGLNAGIGL